MNISIGERKIVIFDLDGTLLNVYKRWYTIHRDLLVHLGYPPIQEKKYIRLKRKGVSEKQILKEKNLSKKDFNFYLKQRIQLIENNKYLEKDVLKDCALNLLKKIRKDYRIFLVTKRKKKTNCIRQLKNLDILPLFSKYYILPTFGDKKRIIRKLATAYSTRAVIIGDTVEDHEIASDLNIHSILVCDGARDFTTLSKLKKTILIKNLCNLNSKLVKKGLKI